jgi:hypothetical protein
MTKASKRTRAQRQSAPKEPAAKKQSEVVKQCVIYMQSTAAFEAGFAADDDEFEMAATNPGSPGAEVHDRARKALSSLISLAVPNREFSFSEMKAMAITLKGILNFERGNVLSGEVQKYVQAFAHLLVIYFRNEAEALRRQNAEGGQS